MISRTSITIDNDLLKQADHAASRLGRPRSWVFSEALRTWLALPQAPTRVVREPRMAYAHDDQFATARAQLIDADLQLSPTQRLRAAEELTRSMLPRSDRPVLRNRVISFDTWEDFLAWDKRDSVR